MGKKVFEEASRYPTPVLKLRGITYVPHYRLNGYAYPGIGKNDVPIPGYKLKLAGAVEVDEMLYKTYGRKS